MSFIINLIVLNIALQRIKSFIIISIQVIKVDDCIRTIDLDNGIIKNLTSKKEYKFAPIPPFMQELLKTGGLINYAKSKM